jgi:hypothetical protein
MSEIRYRRDLHELMEGLPKTAAEIGVAEGFFSSDILRWPVNIERLYCVDAWSQIAIGEGDGRAPQVWHDHNYQEAMARLEPYKDRVTVLKGMSAKMAQHVPDGSLGLLYLDADHSFDGVTADLNAWFPKVCKGGIVAGHDYLTFAGVRRAADAFAKKHNMELHVIYEDKAEDAGFWFRK